MATSGRSSTIIVICIGIVLGVFNLWRSEGPGLLRNISIVFLVVSVIGGIAMLFGVGNQMALDKYPRKGEAASAGFFTSEHFGKFPRIQILTIEDLLVGKTLHMPPSLERTFKQAERVEANKTDQGNLGFE